jgi:hypothetical protein
MSEIKVDTVVPRTNPSTLTIGAAGDTVNIVGTAGTGFPSTTINNNADNKVITGSGTANTLEAEARLLYDGDVLTQQANGSTTEFRQTVDGAGTYWSSLIASASDVKLYTRTNSPLKFGINNATKWQIDTSGNLLPSSTSQGIYLGTASANVGSSPANLLNDYEEGTWTPTVANATVGSSTGHYTKIGNICYITIQLSLTAIGSGNPSQISGLPFTANATSNRNGLIGMVDSRNNSTSTVELHLRSDTNSTLLIFVGKESDVANYDDDLNVMADSFSVNGSGWYTTA